jgi:hypothetical protein
MERWSESYHQHPGLCGWSWAGAEPERAGGGSALGSQPTCLVRSRLSPPPRSCFPCVHLSSTGDYRSPPLHPPFKPCQSPSCFLNSLVYTHPPTHPPPPHLPHPLTHTQEQTWKIRRVICCCGCLAPTSLTIIRLPSCIFSTPLLTLFLSLPTSRHPPTPTGTDME